MKALVSSFLLFLVVLSSATTEARSTPLTCPYWTLFVGVLETSSSAVLPSLVEEYLSGLPVAGVCACVCLCEEPDLSRSETSSPEEYLNFFRGVVKGDKGSIDGPAPPDVVVRGDVL